MIVINILYKSRIVASELTALIVFATSLDPIFCNKIFHEHKTSSNRIVKNDMNLKPIRQVNIFGKLFLRFLCMSDHYCNHITKNIYNQ